jgi:hypothetical protein
MRFTVATGDAITVWHSAGYGTPSPGIDGRDCDVVTSCHFHRWGPPVPAR